MNIVANRCELSISGLETIQKKGKRLQTEKRGLRGYFLRLYSLV